MTNTIPSTIILQSHLQLLLIHGEKERNGELEAAVTSWGSCQEGDKTR